MPCGTGEYRFVALTTPNAPGQLINAGNIAPWKRCRGHRSRDTARFPGRRAVLPGGCDERIRGAGPGPVGSRSSWVLSAG